MNARIDPTPATTAVPSHVKRGTGSQPSTARRLVLGELQNHARNLRFTPHTTPAGLSPQTLASATGVPIAKVRSVLGTMRDVGQVVNVGTLSKPLWRQHTPATNTQARPQACTPPERIAFGTGTYDGAELQRNPGLPASRFAAFDLPSLVNGQRVQPKRITAMCVGALAERANQGRD